jgi:putative MFS transporter
MVSRDHYQRSPEVPGSRAAPFRRSPGGKPAISIQRIVIVCGAGGFLDGYDLLMMSAALLLLVPRFGLSSGQTGLLAALPFLGMAVGALVAGPLADRFGRRPIFLIDVGVFVLVAILLGLSQNYGELLTLRFILGLAIGADMPTASSMLAEFSPPGRRGGLTAMINTIWLGGSVAAGLVGWLLYEAAGQDAWRWMFISGTVPAAVLMIMRHSIPETPRWLAKSGRKAEAAPAAARFGFHVDYTVGPPAISQRGRYRELLSPGTRRIVGFFSGYWFVQAIVSAPLLTYTAVIFHTVVKFSGANALIFNLVINALLVAISLILQFTVMDRHGRKPLALWTCAIACAGTLITAFSRQTSVLLVVAYAIAIGSGQMATLPFWPWSVEQLPTTMRATGQAVGSAAGKLGAFVGVYYLPTALKDMGWTAAFVIQGCVFAVLVAFVAVAGRETRLADLNALDRERAQPL